MFKKNLTYILTVAMSASIATLALAEDAAPVYDADNFPPSFESQVDSGTAAPAPEANYEPRQPLSMEQRIARAEQQIDNLQHKNESAKVDTLQTEIQSLRGQVEQLNHQLQQVQNQQRTLYSDLDKRINKPREIEPEAVVNNDANEVKVLRAQVEQLTQQLQQAQNQKSAGNAITPKLKAKLNANLASDVVATKSNKITVDESIAKTNAQPNVAEEQQIYQTAYDLIKAKKYNEAIAALQKMLRKYPSGQFAANAHYWLGELYGLLGKNEQSAGEFNNVVKSYPDSPKVSDAQLKLGLIYSAQFKWTEAKAAFKKVINRYPGTASARVAVEQLKQIKSAGH